MILRLKGGLILVTGWLSVSRGQDMSGWFSLPVKVYLSIIQLNDAIRHVIVMIVVAYDNRGFSPRL